MTACVFGVTGRMGTGKSHAVRTLAGYFERDGNKLTAIRVDDIRRNILQHAEEHAALRRDIAKRFGLAVSGAGDALNLMEVAQAVFATPENMQDFQALVGGSIFSAVEKSIAAAPEYAAVEWARLAEDGFLPLVHHRVVLMTCGEEALQDAIERLDIRLGCSQSYRNALPRRQADVIAPFLRHLG